VWQERKLWLELLSGSFKLIYKDKNEAAGGAKKEESPAEAG
jgi:hypothetical protein